MSLAHASVLASRLLQAHEQQVRRQQTCRFVLNPAASCDRPRVAPSTLPYRHMILALQDAYQSAQW